MDEEGPLYAGLFSWKGNDVRGNGSEKPHGRSMPGAVGRVARKPVWLRE